jgi:holo-[acyl-carrier protein] synthase
MKTDQQHLQLWEDLTQQEFETLSSEWERTARIKGIGIDITPIPRIAKLIDQRDRETLNVLFTSGEIDRCQTANNPYQFYAVCFATKEAVGKALGTGLAGIGWNEIEVNITHDRLTIHLHGQASIQASKLGVREWLATWSYWDKYVLVHVLAQ